MNQEKDTKIEKKTSEKNVAAAMAGAVNSYENQEKDLVKEIIAALESSQSVAESANRANQAQAKKDRLTKELKKFRADKIELGVRIEQLKKEFGSEDSVADANTLKNLYVELEAVETAIPLLEKNLSTENQIVKDSDGRQKTCKSDLTQDLEGAKASVGRAVFAEMKDIKKCLQNILDEKTNDIISTYRVFMQAFRKAETVQNVVPREFMPNNFHERFLPNSTELENAVGYGLPDGKLRDILQGRMLREQELKNSEYFRNKKEVVTD